MIVFELVGGREEHPAYQELEVSNGNRQYHFLNSIIVTALSLGRPLLSQQIIKSLNFQAICCLHTNAGEYRPCQVNVGNHEPPQHYRVQALMDDFVDQINRNWENTDPVFLATYILWRLNYIHPFINGNGRTARAAAYFAICIKLGNPIQGDTILPELLKINRDEYVNCLQLADAGLRETGAPNLGPLHELVGRLLSEQVASITPAAANTPSTCGSPDAPEC